MGKVLNAVQAKLEELRQREAEPAPDYTADPHKALAYIKRRNAVDYEQTALKKKLIDALMKLPKEKQNEFYERSVRPDARKAFTKEQYALHLDPKSYVAQNHISWIVDDATFGQSFTNGIAVLEELMGPEAADALSEEIKEIVDPLHPAYPEENVLVYPMTKEIDEIKDSLPPFSPDSLMDARILDEVKEDLAYVSDEVRAQCDRMDQSLSGVTGVQTMANQATYDMQNRYIKQDLEGGKFKDKLPKFNSSQASAGHFYLMNDVELNENGPFGQEELDEIMKVKPNVSEGLKNDVLHVTDKLESFGKDKFVNEYTTTVVPNDPSKSIFVSEQGFKHYAYWPLDAARNQLVSAVREKDMTKIRQAHLNYRETKAAYDDMLKTVQKHPTGLCSGNINSTRALPGSAINPLPPEHMKDFVGHSQINGLFCLYALGKNTGATPKELLEDPVKILSEEGKRVVRETGLGTRKTTGEKLFWGLSEGVCNNFTRPWNMHMSVLCTRAFDTVACLSGDPEEQARIAGVGQLAIAGGAVHVNEHKKAWQKVYGCTKEQRSVLLQHAVLLPAEEFDPLKYGEAFSKPDWKQQLDTGALIDRMKQEGKLDYGKLADRVEEIAGEALACDQITGSGFNRDRLIEASHSMFKEMIKKASPQERETEGFKKLEKYTEKMLLTTDSFAQEQSELEEAMDVQLQEKKGLFLSSKNTEEHNRMVRSQNTFRYKLMQMQGKELPEGVSQEDREYLKTITLKQAYDTARGATFDYAVKKTDHGRSARFVHGTGEARFDASMSALESMDDMADKLGLRSPAQKLIDETRLEVFSGRRDDDWSNEKAEKSAAKLMYAMTVAHKGGSAEEQQKMLDPKKVEMGIALIRAQDAFKQMVKNEGLGKLMDRIAEGHGKFTDAYVKGMNDVARKNDQPVGKAPQDMQPEEKGEIWKHNPMPL